jgi:hypothetical protein
MRNKSPLAAAIVGGLLLTMGAAAGAADDAKAKGAAAPPAVAWKDMNAKQKGKFMKTVVVPKMKPLFQEFDAKEFKKFSCETCHGKDPQSREFKMPGPDVPALPGTPAAFEAKMKKEADWPKMVDFMSKKVKPVMAQTLGLPEFDHTKPEAGGFGCQNCHRIEGSEKGAEKK